MRSWQKVHLDDERESQPGNRVVTGKGSGVSFLRLVLTNKFPCCASQHEPAIPRFPRMTEALMLSSHSPPAVFEQLIEASNSLCLPQGTGSYSHAHLTTGNFKARRLVCAAMAAYNNVENPRAGAVLCGGFASHHP